MSNEQQKELSMHQAYGTDVHLPNFEGMALTDYIEVTSVVCAQRHQLTGMLCFCEGLKSC